jgi:metallophosphoesterase superfamily enzyme
MAIAKEREEVLQFLEALHDYARIEIIPGNHDGNIRKITSGYTIHPSSGISIPGKSETVGIIHGHAWPAREIMKCGYVVMGHIHPTVEIRNHLGQNLSHPCWIRTGILREKAKKRYENSNPCFIIAPAFNPLCGGIPVNREGFVGPLGTIMNISQGCVYLLNGTNLGKIKHLQ